MPLDSFVPPSSGSDSSEGDDSDSGTRHGGSGRGAAAAAPPPTQPAGEPKLLRLLSRLRSQQHLGGDAHGRGAGSGGGSDGAGKHVMVPIASSDGEQVPQQQGQQQGQRRAAQRRSTLGSIGSLGSAGDSLTSAEAGHVREALREQRSLSAKPERRDHWRRRQSPSSADEEDAFNEAVEMQLAQDTTLGGQEDPSQHPRMAAPSAPDGEDAAAADGSRPGGVGGLLRASIWPGGKRGDGGSGNGKKGKGGEDGAAKVATNKGMGAVPGLPDQQKIEDWTEQHISELYKASLAKEVNVSRELWDKYTDPARQKRRREQGLKPSVMIGTVTQKITPFRGMRRRHSHKEAKLAGTGRLRRAWERLPMMYPTALAPILIGLIVGVMDCTYSAFFIPVTTVFDMSLTNWNWVTITDCVAAVIFTTDMVATFCTGLVIVNSLRQAVVMDRKLVGMHYIFRGTFLIDVLATGPLWVEVFVVATTNGHASQDVLNVLNVLRCFRLLRLIRVFRAAIKQSFMPTAVRWLPHSLGYFFNLAFTTALVINILGCIWYYTARVGGIREGNTWLSDVGGEDLTGSSDVTQFVAAIYWATTTIATVGYGDITPDDTAERIVAMCIMLLGVLFFGFLIGAVGEFLEHASASAQQGRLFRAKMEGVDRWMEARNLPRHMRAEITAFYSDIWTRHTAYHDNDFFEDLPAALRGKIARYRTRTCIANSELGQALGPRAVLVLSTVILPTALQPGHDLCQQGGPADRLWFLTEGSVLAIAHGRSMARVTSPAVLGESALLAAITGAPAKRPLTYRASVSCCLWELTVDDVMRMKSLQPGILDDLAAHFVLQATKSLHVMDPAHLRQLFPEASGAEDVIAGLQQELQTADDAQSVAAEVIAALDVDVEALGGRRDIVMPTLDKVRALLEGDAKRDNENTTSLRTIGRNVMTTLRLNRTLGGNSLASGAGDGSNATTSAESHSAAHNAEAVNGDGASAGEGETADDESRRESFHRPTRFAALKHLDSRAPVDPERMSLAEAAAWTWHAGADDDAARAAARAAAQRRVSAAMAGVGGGVVAPRSASLTGHASSPGTSSSGGGLSALVPQLMARRAASGGDLPPLLQSQASAPQPPRQSLLDTPPPAASPGLAAAATMHSRSSSDGAARQGRPETVQEHQALLPADSASAAGQPPARSDPATGQPSADSGFATGQPPGEAEAVRLAQAAIAERIAIAEASSRTAIPDAEEPQLQQHRGQRGSATARRPLPWGPAIGGPAGAQASAADRRGEAQPAVTANPAPAAPRHASPPQHSAVAAQPAAAAAIHDSGLGRPMAAALPGATGGSTAGTGRPPPLPPSPSPPQLRSAATDSPQRRHQQQQQPPRPPQQPQPQRLQSQHGQGASQQLSPQRGQRGYSHQHSWAQPGAGGGTQRRTLPRRSDPVPEEEEHSQLQEVLEGRALLTPQQRQRLADFMAEATPEQAQIVHDSALLLEERRLEAAMRTTLQRQAAAQAARDPLRHAWPEQAPHE